MFIKKSFITGMILVVAVVILMTVFIIYGFTEIQISKVTCVVIWSVCIFLVVTLLDKIERL